MRNGSDVLTRGEVMTGEPRGIRASHVAPVATPAGHSGDPARCLPFDVPHNLGEAKATCVPAGKAAAEQFAGSHGWVSACGGRILGRPAANGVYGWER